MGIFSKIVSFFNSTNPGVKAFFSGLWSFGTLKNVDSYININTVKDIQLAYNSCPTLQAIVNTTADVFSSCPFFVEKNNKFLQTHEVFDIISINFLKDFAKQIKLYNECIILIEYTNIVSKKVSKFTVAPRNLVELKYDKNGNITLYQYDTLNYMPEEVLHIYNVSPIKYNSLLTVATPVYSCEQAINVLISAYRVRISLNNRKGGFFIISQKQATNEAVAFNMQTDSEAAIIKAQSDLDKYGFANDNYSAIITTADVTAQPLSFPLSTMELNEGIRQAKAEVCDAMNFPLQVLNSLEGSTFNNKEIADKQLYANSVVSLWKLFEQTISTFFGINFKFDLSTIESLQPNKKLLLETKNIEKDAVIDIIIKYNSGQISYQAASYMLTNLYDYEEENIKILLQHGENKSVDNTEPQ
jgi:hypothetical protein